MGMMILGEICTYSKGLGISRENTDENKEIPYLHYGDLYKKYDFRVNIDKIANTIIKIDNSPKIKEDQFLKNGDIVYTLTSETVDDLGHSTLVINKTQRPFVAGMETTIIRVSDRETVLPEFLNYVFQSRTFKERLHQYVTGMKVFRVHPKDLLKIPIDIPPIDSQHRIVKILNNISDLMDVNKKINDYLAD